MGGGGRRSRCERAEHLAKKESNHSLEHCKTTLPHNPRTSHPTQWHTVTKHAGVCVCVCLCDSDLLQAQCAFTWVVCSRSCGLVHNPTSGPSGISTNWHIHQLAYPPAGLSTSWWISCLAAEGLMAMAEESWDVARRGRVLPPQVADSPTVCVGTK